MTAVWIALGLVGLGTVVCVGLFCDPLIADRPRRQIVAAATVLALLAIAMI